MTRKTAVCCGIAATLTIPFIVVGVSGCVARGGKSSASVEARSTTAGQELQDLEAAREKGLISDKEYQRMRAQIVKREGGAGCGGTGLEAAPLLLWMLWRKRRTQRDAMRRPAPARSTRA